LIQVEDTLSEAENRLMVTEARLTKTEACLMEAEDRLTETEARLTAFFSLRIPYFTGRSAKTAKANKIHALRVCDFKFLYLKKE
jgi:hypothetical protein